jgi:hypothetical protein
VLGWGASVYRTSLRTGIPANWEFNKEIGPNPEGTREEFTKFADKMQFYGDFPNARNRDFLTGSSESNANSSESLSLKACGRLATHDITRRLS